MEDTAAASSNNIHTCKLRPPNLYLIGPQCAGKTTLLDSLRSYYSVDAHRHFANQYVAPPAVIEEVVRKVMNEKGFNAQDLKNPDRGFELQKHILLGQHNAEKMIQGGWYISDRSGIDVLVYAKAYVGLASAKKLGNMDEWNTLRRRMQDAVVVLCEAGNPNWLSHDHARMAYKSVAEWEQLNEEFHDMLVHQGIGYAVLPKHVLTLMERVSLIHDILSRAHFSRSCDM